jgi:hypothetical protein
LEVDVIPRGFELLGASADLGVRVTPKQQRFGLLLEMEKAAGMIERHMTGILAYWPHRTTNSWLGALHSFL